MKAIIPLAIKQDGLYPFNEDKPTGMMRLSGRTLVEKHIKSAKESGADQVDLVCNHKIELYREMFESKEAVKVREQEQAHGTGHAVKMCMSGEHELYLTILGNQYVSSRDVEKTVDRVKHSEVEACLLGDYVSKPTSYGVVSIEDDKVKQIEEKPSNPDNVLVNAGVYCISSKAEDYIQEHLSESISSFASDKSVGVELVSDRWERIGSLEDLFTAAELSRKRIEGSHIHDDSSVDEDASIRGNAVISEGAVVEAGAVLKGDVYIGKNAEIGANSLIENSTICESCVTDNCSIRNSSLWNGTVVEDNSTVDGCLIGDDTTIRPGTSIYNSFIGERSFIQDNNSIREKKLVPDARTDLNEIIK
jgi:bifunctional UDP-N-acetylglucosamine pyrophosphorylase/glucosamine-1-phosphate N-acetyltransferase